MGCDLPWVSIRGKSIRFQSTHPSGVRRPLERRRIAGQRISIHAPQWGATCLTRLTARPTPHFNPRTPVGCDAGRRTRGRRARDFNPRTPVGCDLGRLPRPAAPFHISIHAPQWGATSAFHDATTSGVFQSTHPSGVRRGGLRVRRPPREFQSTHPSGVRLSFPPTSTLSSSISIHAPQWGATGEAEHDGLIRGISIHAPQWGATVAPRPAGHKRVFQSTHPSGVRLRGAFAELPGLGISIHAPQWGATLDGASTARSARYFNPRTPVGCDTVSEVADRADAVFQSTHPSGVRLDAVDFFHRAAEFQSTHPSGVRLKRSDDMTQKILFQSTHPSGVRR